MLVPGLGLGGGELVPPLGCTIYGFTQNLSEDANGYYFNAIFLKIKVDAKTSMMNKRAKL